MPRAGLAARWGVRLWDSAALLELSVRSPLLPVFLHERSHLMFAFGRWPPESQDPQRYGRVPLKLYVWGRVSSPCARLAILFVHKPYFFFSWRFAFSGVRSGQVRLIEHVDVSCPPNDNLMTLHCCSQMRTNPLLLAGSRRTPPMYGKVSPPPPPPHHPPPPALCPPPPPPPPPSHHKACRQIGAPGSHPSSGYACPLATTVSLSARQSFWCGFPFCLCDSSNSRSTVAVLAVALSFEALPLSFGHVMW